MCVNGDALRRGKREWANEGSGVTLDSLHELGKQPTCLLLRHSRSRIFDREKQENRLTSVDSPYVVFTFGWDDGRVVGGSGGGELDGESDDAAGGFRGEADGVREEVDDDLREAGCERRLGSA